MRQCTIAAEGKTFDLQRLTSGAASRLFLLTNPGDISNTYKGAQLPDHQADVRTAGRAPSG